VVGERLVDREHGTSRRLVDHARPVDGVLHDPGVAVPVGEVDVEERPVG
jgi:hypothetical protein